MTPHRFPSTSRPVTELDVMPLLADLRELHAVVAASERALEVRRALPPEAGSLCLDCGHRHILECRAVRTTSWDLDEWCQCLEPRADWPRRATPGWGPTRAEAPDSAPWQRLAADLAQLRPPPPVARLRSDGGYPGARARLSPPSP